MKITSFRHGGRDTYGVVEGESLIDLAPIAGEVGATLRQALAQGSLARIRDYAATAKGRVAIGQVELLPVVPDPEKIICIGINYLTHVKETGREIPKFPMIFTRWPDSQVAHNAPIIRPKDSDKLDFEGELAVIIGKTARHVTKADAFAHVAGYACYNDGSVRDWQRHTIQFTPGKNFPATGGFGPWMVTPDETGDPATLHITTRLNGQVVQDAGIDDLIFDVPTLVEYCSTFTTLNPGDVIITGTTGGVGAFREPPLWMKPGDTVEVEISKIGILVNSIADEKR